MITTQQIEDIIDLYKEWRKPREIKNKLLEESQELEEVKSACAKWFALLVQESNRYIDKNKSKILRKWQLDEIMKFIIEDFYKENPKQNKHFTK